MELHFIINPVAKNGYSIKIWSKIEKVLQKHQFSYHSYFTEGPGDAVRYVDKTLTNAAETVFLIAVGGDGTIHEVVNGAYSFKNGIVGYIPAGSGNDFSRGFLIPRNPKKALQFILNGIAEKRRVAIADVGQFATNTAKGVFVNNLGCGFDAKVVYEVNQSRTKKFFNRLGLGKLTYVYYLIKELFAYKPTDVTVHVDGKTSHFSRVWLVTVANHPYLGGGMKLLPDADPQDGQFNIIIVHDISRLKILTLFVSVFWGGHVGLKGVTILKGEQIQIENDSSVYQHADGEYIGNGKVDIQLKKKVLPVLSMSKHTVNFTTSGEWEHQEFSC